MIGNYHNNEEVRNRIDEVLHKCAMLFQNLGSDSTREEKYNALLEERRLLESVRHLDPAFVNSCLFK